MKKKIDIFKSYGFLDLVDKFFNYPYKLIKNKRKKKALFQLQDNILNSKMPSVNEYKNNRNMNIIVSLTSFPKRFSQLVITLKSIILQDIKPYKIIVYLGSDTNEKDITTEMKEFIKYGVEYRIDNKLNLKGHKKYYYALKEFKDYLVITIDDDIIFPKTMISELLRCHIKYPEAVCARRVHKITKKNNNILPYNLWDKEYFAKNKPSNRLIATTGAGTLYSPYVISRLVDLTFDYNSIINLCLDADDIWMKCMEIMSSIKVVFADNEIMGSFIEVDENYTLMPKNVGKCKNDLFLNEIIKKYKIDPRLFIKD